MTYASPVPLHEHGRRLLPARARHVCVQRKRQTEAAAGIWRKGAAESRFELGVAGATTAGGAGGRGQGKARACTWLSPWGSSAAVEAAADGEHADR
jgi:hypothetical protein